MGIWAAQALGETGFDGRAKVPSSAELTTLLWGGFLCAGVLLFVEREYNETLSSCLQEG